VILDRARRLTGRLLSRSGWHKRAHVAYVDGLPLIVLPEVFDPAAFRSGALLAWAVRIELSGGSGLTVLDLGCGSGVGGVFAARAGARVTCTDINPEAVRNARANAALHGLDIDAREGDLFAPTCEQRFDRILFNPPFFRGAPQGLWDHAWRGERVLERFAEGLGARLAPGGRALLSLSTDGACDELLADLRARSYALERVVERRYLGETATVWRATPSAPG
jgi:release factor glutamine methyltransferase